MVVLPRITRNQWSPLLVATTFVAAVLLLLVYGNTHIRFTPSGRTSQLREDTWHRKDWRLTSDYDIIVSWYDEDVETLKDTIRNVVQRLPPGLSHRVLVYSKQATLENAVTSLSDTVHGVTTLPNVGREGETYLSHIIRSYETEQYDLAEHTIFIQPHIAWQWSMIPRLENLLFPNTGFLSLGPYVTQTGGIDSNKNSFPRMQDIYCAFRGDFFPPEATLVTWAGQFVVSKKRILENRLILYQNLWDKFHAPPDHWIWKEGWPGNGPSNPTLGHALERMWPVIFNCTSATIAETCGEGWGVECVCFD